MDITPLINSNQQVIQNYQSDKVKVSGIDYVSPVIVFPSETLDIELPQKLDMLTLEHLESLLRNGNDLDLILLGLSTITLQKRNFFNNLMNPLDIKYELMELGAACRTYNVLMAEGRRVAVILTPY